MGLKVSISGEPMPQLWLYGEIGDEFGGTTADEFMAALRQIPSKKDIELHIHTDGGSFPDSIAMYGNLARREGKTHVIVDGKAYSGGSVVAMAGETITMAKGSWMMLHEARGGIREATADDFAEAANRLRAINEQLAEIYAKRWRGTRAELMGALKAEKWMRDVDAVGMGMADRVADGPLAIAAYVGEKAWGFRNAPAEVAKAPPDAFPNLLAREAKLPSADLPSRGNSA